MNAVWRSILMIGAMTVLASSGCGDGKGNPVREIDHPIVGTWVMGLSWGAYDVTALWQIKGDGTYTVEYVRGKTAIRPPQQVVVATETGSWRVSGDTT